MQPMHALRCFPARRAACSHGMPPGLARLTWHPPSERAGFGITAVLEDGNLLEKAAANVSVIRGVLTPTRAQAMSSRGRAGIDPKGGQPYAAAALSLVFHSAHPMVPTLRGDVRLFQVEGQAWMGGGCDLTPNYVSETDSANFHAYWKAVCDKYGPNLYPQYKELCDK
jgi:coproporphyrinogen III oxidase